MRKLWWRSNIRSLESQGPQKKVLCLRKSHSRITQEIFLTTSCIFCRTTGKVEPWTNSHYEINFGLNHKYRKLLSQELIYKKKWQFTCLVAYMKNWYTMLSWVQCEDVVLLRWRTMLSNLKCRAMLSMLRSNAMLS